MGLSPYSPSTPFPHPLTGDAGPQQDGDQGDGLDDMTKPELAAMADGLGLAKTGNKSDLIHRIREYRMSKQHEDQSGVPEHVPGDGSGGPAPEQDTDHTGADAHPAPDHDGITEPDERDNPAYGDDTAAIGD